MPGRVLGPQVPRAMDPDSGTVRPAAARRHGDLDDSGTRSHPPESRRAAVAQNSFRSTGKYGSEPAAALADPVVADCVDPAVQAVETTGTYPPPNTRTVNTDLSELFRRDHPVLPRGKTSQAVVLAFRADFVSHSETKAAHPRPRPLTQPLLPPAARPGPTESGAPEAHRQNHSSSSRRTTASLSRTPFATVSKSTFAATSFGQW
jgi:hypothetical protein